MSHSPKKHGFSLTFSRQFTRGDHDPYHLIHFREPEISDDEWLPAIECPDNWSLASASILADEAACRSIPLNLKPIEENTVPSFLWRRTGTSKTITTETSTQQIFDRVVGSATYSGWKQGLFTDEASAQAFFDDARYALIQRLIAFEPHFLATLGLDWAYGIQKQPDAEPPPAIETAHISNAMIDEIVSGRANKNSRAQWQQLLVPKSKSAPITLCFADIASDWGTDSLHAPIATVDLMAFRHNDGSVNIDKLRQATKLLVTLIDLHDQPYMAIGFSNLAPLLMALSLRYDSNAARATTAALGAIMTAEAYATSAELAGLRGISQNFAANRDITLRALRNYGRTAWGDHNDYEKISVLPAPLTLAHCPDLALVAAARTRWDEALALARQYGLRATQVTSLTTSPSLTLYTESSSQGIGALPSLIITRGAESENFYREIHPSAIEALVRLGYDRADSQTIAHYIAGIKTLAAAPVLNHASLRAKKFGPEALQRVDDYLPRVDNVRLAFTPWILGQDFCRQVLKIPAKKLQDPTFDMLRHLGFSTASIAAANLYVYGHDTAKGAKPLKAKDVGIFTCKAEIAPEAQIRMAAAVQSFISGTVDLHISLPVNALAERKEKLLLAAWRQGVKSLVIDNSAPKETAPSQAGARKIRPSLYTHTKNPGLPTRKMHAKAKTTLISHKKPDSTSRRPSNKKH